MPLAVQITAQLLHLKLSDNTSTWKGTQDFDSHAGGVDGKVPVTRLAYAMVVTRLVNGVVEPEQRAHGYAASVSDIASRCGLPRWFVDLRHDATHTSLPTLVTLRLAADTALEWLQSRYWDSQAAHLDAEPDRLRILVNEAADLNHKVYLAASQSTKTKKSKKKRKRELQQQEQAAAQTENTNESVKSSVSRSLANAESDQPQLLVSTLQDDLESVTKRLTQSVGPTMIRDVVVPSLINQVDGLLLLHNNDYHFDAAGIHCVLARWCAFLEAIHKSWPFFYGCLCASIAECLLAPETVQKPRGCPEDSEGSASHKVVNGASANIFQ